MPSPTLHILRTVRLRMKHRRDLATAEAREMFDEDAAEGDKGADTWLRIIARHRGAWRAADRQAARR